MLMGLPRGEVPVEDVQDSVIGLIEYLMSLCGVDSQEEVSGVEEDGPALSEGVHSSPT